MSRLCCFVSNWKLFLKITTVKCQLSNVLKRKTRVGWILTKDIYAEVMSAVFVGSKAAKFNATSTSIQESAWIDSDNLLSLRAGYILSPRNYAKDITTSTNRDQSYITASTNRDQSYISVLSCQHLFNVFQFSLQVNIFTLPYSYIQYSYNSKFLHSIFLHVNIFTLPYFLIRYSYIS